MMSTALFTAAQIARALSCSKQNVHQQLAGTPADDSLRHCGNVTKAWKIKSLPEAFFEKLSKVRERHCYQSIEDLLNDQEFGRDTPPTCASPARGHSKARDRRLENLENAFASLEGATDLTCQQRSYIWMKACDDLSDHRRAGAPEKKTKTAILRSLLASRLFGTDKETIRRNLNRQWAKYQLNDGKLQDRRTLRDQRRRLPEVDRNKLIARSLDCGGRRRQAFRELRDSRDLSQETLARTTETPSRKSYMPKSIDREIAAEVNRLMPLHRSEREFELRGPYVPQDYSAVAAGEIMQLDDVTLPVYYWEDDPEAPGGVFFGRGQWILAIDVRSRMVLGHALHSAPVYNMRIVRSLLLRVHDEFGLPETLLLERGMWRTAKIIKGDELDITETEQGLREFGVKFRHRTKPRGKIIERIIGLLQNQMERLPGYVGRDERHDRFDRVQEQIRDVESGRNHPRDHSFLHKSQWLQELDRIICRYNRDPQEGQLQTTPIEAWNKNLSPEGTVRLGASARYLLAHHKKPIKVQSRGIRLPSGLGGGLYYNEITGRFAGQQMIAWINPDELDAIVLTSLDRKEGPFVVERANPLSPVAATDDEICRAQAQIAAHNGYARTQYRTVRDQLAQRRFRHLIVDRPTVDLGERVNAETSSARHARQKVARAVSNAQRAVRGRINVRVDAKNALRAKESVDLLDEVYTGNAQ